jgi:hypothetical protein
MSARPIAWALAALLCGACGHKSVDVTPLTNEDESLKKNESELSVQRGALQRERKKLADARAEITDRRKQLGHDSAGQAALDDEERKLQAQETDLDSRETQINGKLDDLLKQRADLVQRATQVVATGPGADPLERAAKREAVVATREKDMATREATLAAREKDLADRERTLAKREKETCSVAPAPIQIEVPKGLKYSAHDVEPIYRKALKLMAERGLLATDLPPGAARLVDETRENMKKGDYVRAKYDAEALLSTVEEIKIDRAFISNKMARLAQAMRGKKLGASENDVFQEATANYGDGKFGQANTKINKLFSMLR